MTQADPPHTLAFMDEVEQLAKKRQGVHDAWQNGTPRLYKDRVHEDRVGVAVELAFEKEYGFRMDRSVKPHGDGGTDFITPAGRVNVKGALKPYNLLVKEHEIHRADVYVLARYADGEVTFLGWETQGEMLKCEKRQFTLGVPSYCKHASKLRPMSLLGEALTRQLPLGKAKKPSPFEHLYSCLKGKGSLRDQGWVLTEHGYIADPPHKPALMLNTGGGEEAGKKARPLYSLWNG